MPALTDLPDVNVWVALTLPEHPHYARALTYWREEAGTLVVFNRLTALGLLRLISSAGPMAGHPLSVAQAWKVYQDYRSRPSIGFAGDPAECETLLQVWADTDLFTARLWADAYLAAFALAGGYRLVTFDRDFGRFEGLDLLLLSP